MQVVLEVSVITLHHRHTEVARNTEPCVVRREWRLYVHDVDFARLKCLTPLAQRAHGQQAVFRVTWDAARRQTEQLIVVGGGSGVFRGYQQTTVPSGHQITSIRLNGRGNAIHPREVNIRDHQDLHQATLQPIIPEQ